MVDRFKLTHIPDNPFKTVALVTDLKVDYITGVVTLGSESFVSQTGSIDIEYTPTPTSPELERRTS